MFVVAFLLSLPSFLSFSPFFFSSFFLCYNCNVAIGGVSSDSNMPGEFICRKPHLFHPFKCCDHLSSITFIFLCIYALLFLLFLSLSFFLSFFPSCVRSLLRLCVYLFFTESLCWSQMLLVSCISFLISLHTHILSCSHTFSYMYAYNTNVLSLSLSLSLVVFLSFFSI